MANELSRIDPTAEGAIASHPTQGRTPGRKRKNQLEVQAPTTVESDRAEYQQVMGSVLNTAAGQLADVVGTTQEAIRTMETGVVQYLAEDLSGSPARIADGLNRATGGMNNAATFRSTATGFAADFVANLRSSTSNPD